MLPAVAASVPMRGGGGRGRTRLNSDEHNPTAACAFLRSPLALAKESTDESNDERSKEDIYERLDGRPRVHDGHGPLRSR